MEVRIVETPVHGRALFERRSPDRVLVGFHGYAETAAIHFTELERIGADGWSLLAIQALHPFYTKKGDVVASWMTKEDRQQHIADNLEYVGRVLRDVGIPRRAFVGFSQGVAMAYRAAARFGGEGVIALAGDVPPDVRGTLPPVLIGRGTREEWYAEEKLRADLEVLGTGATVATFDGGHEWTDAFRAELGRFLSALAG